MSNTYLIGDIHGCFEDFIQLIEKMPLGPSDQLILLGDLASKGPDGVKMLEWLVCNRNIRSILGNHDLILLHDILVSPVFNPKEWLETLQASKHFSLIVDWLRNQPLIMIEPSHCFVHAGLYHEWDDNDLKQIASETPSLIEPNFLKKHFEVMHDHLYPAQNDPHFWVNVLVNIRFIDKKTNKLIKDFHAPEKRLYPDSIPWFEPTPKYSPDLNVYFGHWSMLKALHHKNVWCLDGGCVYGNTLVGMRVEDQTIYTMNSSIRKR